MITIESELLAPGRGVLVLLSGGRDSTCLLDLAVRVAGPPAVRALHVNYGLRAAADGDQAHCLALCDRLGVDLTVERTAAAPGTGNLQAWARELRYQAATALAGSDDIAVGHTATDQVETILYRLASSPSRRALLGMADRDGQVIRPLLRYTRAQTAAYCLEQRLTWREDESNTSDFYARNRIRSELVPALARVHPAAEANVIRLAEILRDEAELLDGLVDEALKGRSEIELELLKALPLPLARLVAQRLADAAAGGPAPGTARRVEEILALRNAGALDLPHGVRAVVSRGRLTFVRRNDQAGSPPPVTKIR